MTPCCSTVRLKHKSDLSVMVVVRYSYRVGDLKGGEHPPVDLVNTSSKYNLLQQTGEPREMKETTLKT